MKKKLEAKTERSNKHWTKEEIAFIKQFYGAVKTDCIADVLNRSAIAVWQQCKTQGFKLNERIYSAQPIEAMFNNKTYELKAFRYTRKENGATVDKTIIRKKTGRPRKTKQEPKTELMAAHRRKPDARALKPNNKEQTAKIQEFKAPEGKTLVKIDSKTYVYR